MMNYEKKVCCICGPGSSKTAGVNAALPAEGLGFAELQDQWNGFFKDTDKERSFFPMYVVSSVGCCIVRSIFMQNSSQICTKICRIIPQMLI